MHSILSIILLILIFSPIVQGANHLEVHFIDVGQGDAILIKTPSGQNVLIDTGNLSTGDKMKRYLKDEKVSTLNALIITHMHPDHVGGLFCLVPDLAVEKIYDNGAVLIGYDFWEEYINLIKNLKIKREILEEGDEFSFGRVRLRILSPSKPLTGDMNGDSIVIKISYDRQMMRHLRLS
jgi:competence protein ComEC